MKYKFGLLYDILSIKEKKRIEFRLNKILYMTLYKHLGPISFEFETEQFQVFSGCNQTLILQFKNYEEVNIDEMTELLSVYQLILKKDNLLEIYSQKNKPSSILIHKSVSVGFQKINIQLLCRILKEMITSIVHTKKVIPGKMGQIAKEMFFQIDGELRYLYFPVRKSNQKSQNLVSEVLQFINKLKDEKELSHRLLLKKILKCNTLEQVLDQTEYFLNIYHARQSHTLISNPNNTTFQQNFGGRTLNKTKFGLRTFNNENSMAQFRNSNAFGLANDSINSKNNNRRKYNLFKNTESNTFRNSLNTQSNGFTSSTWRKPKKQSLFQNNTFRSNSKAVHIDTSQRGVKNQSVSLFNRASSVNQSPKKLSTQKRKGLGFSVHTQSQNLSSTNESFSKVKGRNLQTRKNFHGLQSCQMSQLNESIVSKNLNDSKCRSKHNESLQKQQKNIDSSQWMKQMVSNSLEKWKQKSSEKGNIFSKINDKDREGSTQVDSRSKFLEKYERPSYDILRQSNISSIHPSKYINKNQAQKPNDNQSHHPVGSERKLKRGNVNINNRSQLINAQKPKQQRRTELLQRTQEEFEFCTNNNNFVQKENHLPTKDYLNVEQSLEEIDLCKSSIEHLAMKNKEEQLKLSKVVERKKTSIKEIVENNKTLERNISDESQTQRIQYSHCSKKKIKPEPQQSKKPVSMFEAEIQSFEAKLQQIFAQKAQIDFIGVAVVQTTEHLKSFESIFWQLPMFFMYKKFYQNRLKLCQKVSQILDQISVSLKRSQDFMQIEAKTKKYYLQLQQENINIEQSLKKLLKTVKKKIKKEYTSKDEQQHIDKHLHLDYTINYDHVINEFTYAYLQSLLEAKNQFPQLVFHIVEIFEAYLVIKGKTIDSKQKEAGDVSKDKVKRLERMEAYYAGLLKKKEIKILLNPEPIKTKSKK